MEERTGAVTFQGKPLTLLGSEPKVGDDASDVTLLANDLSEVKLSSLRGKVVIIASVPSLDTPVCSAEGHRFNEEAASLGDDVAILAVSTDLPFAQGRWCGAAGIDKVQTLSDHREVAFGLAYGVLIKELRLLARAVFVVNRNGNIVYTQLVGEIVEEPDYLAALAAAKDALAK